MICLMTPHVNKELSLRVWIIETKSWCFYMKCVKLKIAVFARTVIPDPPLETWEYVSILLKKPEFDLCFTKNSKREVKIRIFLVVSVGKKVAHIKNIEPIKVKSNQSNINRIMIEPKKCEFDWHSINSANRIPIIRLGSIDFDQFGNRII